jgi:hypothetical protein
MSGRAGIRIAGSGLSRVPGAASVFVAGIVLSAIAACSSSQTTKPEPVTPTRTGGPPSGSSGQGGLTGLRVIYHATFKDADPSAQTITFLGGAGGKFRVTYDPPGYQDFAVSDGVQEVDSVQGELTYGPINRPPFRFGPEDLPQFCAEANRVGRTTVLARTADRYTCKAPGPDELSEITIDSGSGILLSSKSETSTIAATSIDMTATIPAGSFDVPKLPLPTQGLLNSKSPGVPDAQSAATAIEKCRADAHGALPAPIRATKGPKVILHCGAKTEAFAVTPGNSVDYQPHDGQYDITVTLPDGSMVSYASSKCPGTPICINN